MDDIITDVKQELSNQIQEFGNDLAAQVDLFKIISFMIPWIMKIHATISITTLLLIVATIIIIALKK